MNDFISVNTHAPNAGEKLQNKHWKLDTWYPQLFKPIQKLQQKKPILGCGDFNVAHAAIDFENPTQNTEREETHQTRKKYVEKSLNECNLIDTC